MNNLKGGYIIIDLESKYLSDSPQSIKGIYSKIKGSLGKPIILHNVQNAGTGNNVINIYGLVTAIHDAVDFFVLMTNLTTDDGTVVSSYIKVNKDDTIISGEI